ncbi:sigma factor, partial [Paludisphaera soli]|uniref:sigma factor n=1 Tax=Paludisphaera soli TaxID=2712865 RepID=UPI001980217C
GRWTTGRGGPMRLVDRESLMRRVETIRAEDAEAAESKQLTEGQRRLVEEHVAYAEQMAEFRVGSLIPLEDRKQDAVMGLMDAARNFEPDVHGANFRTYAYKRILGAMIDAERERPMSIVKLSRLAWSRADEEERKAVFGLSIEGTRTFVGPKYDPRISEDRRLGLQ